MTRKHNHYFKDVSGLTHVDVYRVLELYNVTNPCIQHAVKKLLVAGGRGAGKDIGKDIQESIDSLERWKGMQAELSHAGPVPVSNTLIPPRPVVTPPKPRPRINFDDIQFG